MTDMQKSELEIYVRDDVASQIVFDERDVDAPTTHSRSLLTPAEKVVAVPLEVLAENWKKTIATIGALGNEVDVGESGWGISEIEIGLTLGAEGQLFLIAKASAEASVTIRLSRR